MQTIIRMEHCRQLKYCASGVREFFKNHNLDYVGFLNNGIDADYLLDVTHNDAMVIALVEVAKNGRK